jgi:hypothetical protein
VESETTMTMRMATARTALRGLLLLTALLAALTLRAHGQPPAHAATRAGGATAHYAAGWNIVAAPTGTVLTGVSGSLLGFGPTSSNYTEVASTSIVGGRAVWAYFAGATDVALDTTAATFSQTVLPPNHFAMIGNPSTTQALAIHGADLALSYDAAKGYQPVTQLAVGQGAFVLSRTGGVVSVGSVPSEAISAQIIDVQRGLTDDAANPATFGMIPDIANELLTAHDYGSVQAAMDDLRSAFSDGLVKENAAQPPKLSSVQLTDVVNVRQKLAQAQTAVANGDMTAETAALGQARMNAQASEDEGVAIARSESPRATPTPTPAMRYLDVTYTPQSLARYGDLCTASVPALALALAPNDQFGPVVVATLNNQPVPPATH